MSFDVNSVIIVRSFSTVMLLPAFNQ